MPNTIRALLIASLMVGVWAGTASAQVRCDADDLLGNRSAVKAALICRASTAWGDGGDGGLCPPIENACIEPMTDALSELLIGPSVRPTACQIQALWAGAGYTDRRMRERAWGKRAAGGAERIAAKIESACDGTLAADDHDFGGQCAELLSAGVEIPGEALALCLRASIERILGDAAPARLRPNVILIVTDDQRVETTDDMPALDRLADQGVRFTNGFVTTALCSPSRASIFSGQYVHHHGSFANQQEFDDSDTLAPWMHAAGYATGFFGKYRNDTVRGTHVPPGWTDWQSFNDPPGEQRRCPGGGNCFTDYWLNENGELVFYAGNDDSYPTDLLARRVGDFIGEHAQGPFFAVYAPPPPHGPAIPASRHVGSFEGIAPWRPPSWGVASGKPLWLLFFRRLFTAERAAVIDSRRILELESLQSVDEAVAAMIDDLERRGLRDNTLVLYTSDHGVHWGEHGWTSKLTPYEEAIRVPYIVSYPARAPIPQVRPELVLNIDIAPTIASLAGADTAEVDGMDFEPLLSGNPTWRDAFLIENFLAFVVSPSEAVRTERWKFIRSAVAHRTFDELYDLESDPYEMVNLASDPAHAAVREQLSERLGELRRPIFGR